MALVEAIGQAGNVNYTEHTYPLGVLVRSLAGSPFEGTYRAFIRGLRWLRGNPTFRPGRFSYLPISVPLGHYEYYRKAEENWGPQDKGPVVLYINGMPERPRVRGLWDSGRESLAFLGEAIGLTSAAYVVIEDGVNDKEAKRRAASWINAAWTEYKIDLVSRAARSIEDRPLERSSSPVAELVAA